jgi:L-threonylcarbamoyladenylate synthase
MIVRLGSLTPEDFKPILGYVPLVIMKEPGTQPLCPGQLFRHYAPQAELFLGNPLAMEQASFILGFKERDYPESKRILYLGSLQQPSEVAENLYAILRQLDLEQVPHAWVDMDFPREGLWLTIAERLQRAGVKE